MLSPIFNHRNSYCYDERRMVSIIGVLLSRKWCDIFWRWRWLWLQVMIRVKNVLLIAC